MNEHGPNDLAENSRRPRPALHPAHVLADWTIVLLGTFCIRPRAELRSALVTRGVTLEDSPSFFTTHLVVGSDNFDKTVAEIDNNTETKTHDLPIVGERLLWGILNGVIDDVCVPTKRSRRRLSESAPVVEKKPSQLTQVPEVVVEADPNSMEGKVLQAVKKMYAEGDSSVSMAQIETAEEFEEAFFEADFGESLLKAIDCCVENGMLLKDGASYTLPGAAVAKGPSSIVDSGSIKDVPIPHSVDNSSQHAAGLDETFDSEGECDGGWQGLRYVRELASSGNMFCFACDKVIEEGAVEMRMLDVSTESLVGGGEPKRSGLLRDGSLGFQSIAQNEIAVHEGCVAAADEKCRLRFERNWKPVGGDIESAFPQEDDRHDGRKHANRDCSSTFNIDRSEFDSEVFGGDDFDISPPRLEKKSNQHRLQSTPTPVRTYDAPRRPSLHSKDSAGHRKPGLSSRPPVMRTSCVSDTRKRARSSPAHSSNPISKSEKIGQSSSFRNAIGMRKSSLVSRNPGNSSRSPLAENRPRKDCGSISRGTEQRTNRETLTTSHRDPEPEIEGDWKGLKQMGRKTSKGRSRCYYCNRTIDEGDSELRMKDYSLMQMVKTLTKRWSQKKLRKAPQARANMITVHEDCAEDAEEKCEKQFEKAWRKIAHLFVEDEEEDE